MKISVVIPCYNERETAEERVAAVRAAPVSDLEIIVVNDGSTDGIADLLRERIESVVAATRVEQSIAVAGGPSAQECTNVNLTDMETCYKAFRRSVIEQFELCEDRFGFEPEITAKVVNANCRIYEVGISYDGRTYAEGKGH